MTGLLMFFGIVFLVFQIFFAIMLYRLFEIDSRLVTSNLLLTVIANKLGATEEDVKNAESKK